MKLIREGMGTENALEVLAAMIKMTRPKLCLEIGAGDSSIAIAAALFKSKEESSRDLELVESSHWSERGELLIPLRNKQSYEPKLISIDNFSAKGCSASKAWRMLDEYASRGVIIQKINSDFYELPESFYRENKNFDFIWVDAGTLVDDVQFIGKLWPLLAEGGILSLHEPYCTASVKEANVEKLAMVRTPLWESIAKAQLPNVDILSFPEEHKYRQSGLGILRKRHSWEANRETSFQEEMIALGEAPIRFSATGLLSGDALKKLKEEYNLRLLKNSEARSVLYAIGLRASSVEEIKKYIDLEEKKILKWLNRLLSANIIEYQNGLYSENATLWENIGPSNSLYPQEMSDAELEKPEVLDLIASYFSPEKNYSEFYISQYCSYFTQDYARLRRKLVDSGRLLRTNNIYRVN